MSSVSLCVKMTAAASLFAAIGLALGLTSGEGTRPVAESSAAPAAFKIDPVHSTNVFRIRHNDVANFYGRFKEMSGTVNWDDADPSASSLKVEIPVASVDTGVDARNNHLKSADFFNAAQFPTLSFVSTSVSKAGENTFKLSGDLTIHGVTKPVTVDLVKTGAGKSQRGGDLVGFETTFTIKRTDYGMDFMVGTVGDEVQVIVAIEAGKQ